MAGPVYSDSGDTYPGPMGFDSLLSVLSGGGVSPSGSMITASCPGQYREGMAKAESSVLPWVLAGKVMQTRPDRGHKAPGSRPEAAHTVALTWVSQTSEGAVPLAKYSV